MRSHERRTRAGIRPRISAVEMLPVEPRDLTDSEVWDRSRWRANARREAASRDFELRTPSPRGMSLAALFALTAAPAATLGAGLLASPPEAEAKARTASRGGGVKKLQRKLGIPADGVFGPQTKRALKRWQRRHGMVADGIAGPATRSAMGIGAGPVLKQKGGSGGKRKRSRRARAGGGVSAMQRALGVSADGVFGPATERALKRWQRRHGLVADGVAGPATRRALGIGPGKMLKRGGRGAGGGNRAGVVQRVIAAGNRIAYKPYKYGGGHGSFRDSGYDCSGSVSYALHGGGLLRVPRDSGDFMSYGRPGRGRHITIYANPGHVYMVVNGRRFDTSARRISGSRWTGQHRSTAGYVARHPAGL